MIALLSLLSVAFAGLGYASGGSSGPCISETIQKTAADSAQTTSVWEVTELSFAVVASAVYHVEFYVDMDEGATGHGGSIWLDAPADAITTGVARAGTAAATEVMRQGTEVAPAATNSLGPAGHTPASGWALIRTVSAGTVSVWATPELVGSSYVQVLKDSYVWICRLR